MRPVRILKFRSLKLPISSNLLVPIHPYPSLLFAILRDLSRFFAIPRYKDHEPHEPSRPTLFIHFVLLTSFLFSLLRLSGECKDDKTVDDDWDVATKSTMSRRDKRTRY